MKRRQLLLAAAALAAAPGVRAQAPRQRRVAIASPGIPNPKISFDPAFKNRLAELGWVEGRDIVYLHAYASGDANRYVPMITDLLAQKPDVLVVSLNAMTRVGKELTQDVPIVFAIASNPEKYGLVASLAKPGGNVTGVSTRELELLGKRIEILREIRPGVRRLALLVNPRIPEVAKLYAEGYEEQSRKLGMQLLTVEAQSEADLRPAFDRMARARAQAFLVTADSTHFRLREQIVGHVARLRMLAAYPVEPYVEAGGLLSYGIDLVDQYRRAAAYVDKILRGARPADLPVQEPTEFHLALNLKAAREQRIKFPQSVLLRANQVIE